MRRLEKGEERKNRQIDRWRKQSYHKLICSRAEGMYSGWLESNPIIKSPGKVYLSLKISSKSIIDLFQDVRDKDNS